MAGIDLGKDPRSSLLGDGIVSCTQRFDDLESDRARSIIVTSDNDPLGEAVYSVQEGADYAADRDVLVHAIAVPQTRGGAALAVESRTRCSPPGAPSPRWARTARPGRWSSGSRRRTAAASRSRRVGFVTEAPRQGTWVATAGVGVLAVGWLAQAWASPPHPRRQRGTP